jgi:hypothetical protein
MMMVLSRFVSADCCASFTVYHRLVDAPIFTVNLFLMVSAFSCGTQDNVIVCGRIDNILIISPISYGWETRSSWLRQGELHLGLLGKNTGYNLITS